MYIIHLIKESLNEVLISHEGSFNILNSLFESVYEIVYIDSFIEIANENITEFLHILDNLTEIANKQTTFSESFDLVEIANPFYGFNIIFLYIISLMCILSGILIVITKNPVVSVLYLIFLFSNISCYLIFIGLNFIGLSYLLVYVGAVSILFLFILMLINIRVSELIGDTNNSIPLAILIILAFFTPINNIVPSAEKENTAIKFLMPKKEEISQVCSFN